MSDLYNILGVSPDASAAVIGKAFRKLAKSCHPDLFPGEMDKEYQFVKLSQAYEVLSNPAARDAYDARRVQASYQAASQNQNTATAAEATSTIAKHELATLVAQYTRKYRNEDDPESFTDFMVMLFNSPITYCALFVIALLISFNELVKSFVK